MNKLHFKRKKHQKAKYICIASLVVLIFVIGAFVIGLEDSIEVKSITEGYNLNVKF